MKAEPCYNDLQTLILYSVKMLSLNAIIQ